MLLIKLDREQNCYSPGQLISGTIEASDLPAETHQLAIRLLWFTIGKGTRDVNTCCEIVRAVGPQTAALAFEFLAPYRPLSFSGQLISLQWAIEVVAFPSKKSSLIEIVIAQSGSEVVLVNVEDELKRLGINKPVLQLGNVSN